MKNINPFDFLEKEKYKALDWYSQKDCIGTIECSYKSNHICRFPEINAWMRGYYRGIVKGVIVAGVFWIPIILILITLVF